VMAVPPDAVEMCLEKQYIAFECRV
jgi:hypothetical protein